MWSRFSPIFWATQKGLRIWATIASLSPLIPLILWCFATKGVDIEESTLAFSQPKVPQLVDSHFSLKERSLEDYLQEIAEGIYFLGLNRRPDCRDFVAIYRLAKEGDNLTVGPGETRYLQIQNGHFECSEGPTALSLSLVEGGQLQLTLKKNQEKSSIFLPQRYEKKGEEILWARRQIEKWRYLGSDKVQEFLGKTRGVTQFRLFDEMQQRMVVLTDHDLFTLKDGKIVFFADKSKASSDILCVVKRAQENQVELGIWDAQGISEERCLIPLHSPEKMGTKVEALFLGAKRFGHEALWLRKEWKQAVYVGDWLLEERGEWKRPTKERLEEALQGRYKGALAYFASLKKETEKWVAEIFVFDSLHIHKERILVPIESKINVLNTTKRGPLPKEVPLQEKNNKRLIPIDRSQLPKAREAMLEEMGEEEVEGHR